MLIAPVLVVLSSGANVFIQGIASKYELFLGLDYIVKLLIAAIPYVLIWVLFTLIYIVMPNTKVNFRYAIIAGIIAGTMFQMLQWGYITFQGSFSRYNAVYGTFAALPLFLIWMQTSWIIVLFGAEVSFAYQNIENYEFESESLNISIRSKKLLTLLVSHLVIKRFSEGKSPFTATEISHQLEIPIRLIRDIIDDLVSSNIFSEVATENPKEIKYQPSLDIHKMTINFVLNKIDETGRNTFHASDSETLQKLEIIQDEFYKSLDELPSNKLIKEI
jgi:membrane protein